VDARPAVAAGHLMAAAASTVEYSVDGELDRMGVMVGGGPELLDVALRVSREQTFAGDWSLAVRRICRIVGPDALLFRCDWTAARVTTLTLYVRFPREPDDDGFQAVAREALAGGWTGPAVQPVARVLGVHGPRGIAMRVGENGGVRLASYFQSALPAYELPGGVATDLVRACGFPDGAGEGLRGDLAGAFGPGTVGVVGLNPGTGGVASALKLNPANVPVERAFALLRARGAPDTAIARIASLAGALRARLLSYLGMSFGADGFAGWRAYLTVSLAAMPRPVRPRLTFEPAAIPSLRCPHY
jgi:hypothetical protein